MWLFLCQLISFNLPQSIQTCSSAFCQVDKVGRVWSWPHLYLVQRWSMVLYHHCLIWFNKVVPNHRYNFTFTIIEISSQNSALLYAQWCVVLLKITIKRSCPCSIPWRHICRELVGCVGFKQLCCSVLQNLVQDANFPVFYQAIRIWQFDSQDGRKYL